MSRNEEIFYVIKNTETVKDIEGFQMRINRFRAPYSDIDSHEMYVSGCKYIGKPEKYHTFVK